MSIPGAILGCHASRPPSSGWRETYGLRLGSHLSDRVQWTLRTRPSGGGLFFPRGSDTSLPTQVSDAGEKARLRAVLLQGRRALAPEDVQVRGARVQARLLATPEFQKARTVALYAALPG